MNTRRAFRPLLAATIAIATTPSSRAQCQEWSSGFELPGFAGEPIYVTHLAAFAVHDDGSGPALFAAGAFTSVEGMPASYIAKWNGASWSALGDGLNPTGPNALAVFDDGSGPALYAGGSFTMSGATNVSNVARWNGSSWSALGYGLNGDVRDLEVFDDGSGPALYAGGAFTMSGTTSVGHIAKWDGANWIPLMSGIDGPVYSLVVFDDGSGPTLCAAGYFSNAGGSPARNFARWDGAAWSALATNATPASASVYALVMHDDGSGPALFVGGEFSSIDGTLANNVAKWNGTSWSAVGGGVTGGPPPWAVHALVEFDDGSGEALYAGAAYNGIARWDGALWSPVGSGFNFAVFALAVFDDGSGAGPRLHAGGDFQVSGDAFVNKFARWDGSAWSLPSYGQGVEPKVKSLAVYDDGAGAKLYVGGYFDGAGRSAANGIAGWDGASWSSLGDGIGTASGLGTVFGLHVFDDGSGEALFAGGLFFRAGDVTANHVAKWNGTSWSALGNGFDNVVYDFTVFDDGTGPALYACGEFTATTGLLLKRVAKWNGSVWSAVGSGTSGPVSALAVFDDGSGAALYAGGAFGVAGGTSASNIARWNGVNWTAVGGGMNIAVDTLTVFDDGSGGGPALYAGGSFTIADGVAATRLARWNGSAWSGAGLHADGRVRALEVFDDGTGPALFASGDFTLIGGSSASRIAKFDGTIWSPLGVGTDAPALAMAAYDDGTGGGSELYLGGSFQHAGGIASSGIARWGACRPGDAYCFGDGLDPFITADCPCANFGDPGHGCANSNALLGGAHLTALGTTNPNTVLFTCDGIPNNTLCTFFRNFGSAGAGAVYGDGVRCLTGTGIRFGQQNSGQNGNPPNTVSSGAATVAPGLTRYYQVQYRNSAPAFCPPATFNASNAYSISW